MTSGLFYHIHHESLMEWTDNLEERIAYIKANKPKDEIATRLRWMTPVTMPQFLRKADQKREETYQKREETYQKREETYQKRKEAYQKWNEADQKLKEAYQKWEEADQKWKEADREKQHRKDHPGCPWNGKTIFP